MVIPLETDTVEEPQFAVDPEKVVLHPDYPGAQILERPARRLAAVDTEQVPPDHSRMDRIVIPYQQQ